MCGEMEWLPGGEEEHCQEKRAGPSGPTQGNGQ